MLFILFFLTLVLIWCMVFYRRNSVVDTLIISSFITIVELSYVPQVTSLFFSTLSAAIICFCITTLPLLILATGKFKMSEFHNFARELLSLANRTRRLIASSRFLVFLGSLFLLTATYLFLYMVLLNSFGWDGEGYHSSAAAWFNQSNQILKIEDNIKLEINTYPKNVELISMMTFKLNGSDRLLELYQLIFYLLSLPVLYKVSLHFLKNQRGALIAAFLILFHTLMIRQLRTTYIDAVIVHLIAISLYFLIRCKERNFDLFSTGLLGISLGYICQTKGSGLHTTIVFFIFSATLLLTSSGTKNKLSGLFCLLMPVTLFGGGWWLKNYLQYSNPFYPFAVNLGLITFPGRASLGLNIYHIDLSSYEGLRRVILHFKFLAGISLFYLVVGYAALPLYLLNTLTHIKKGWKDLLIFLIPLCCYFVVPFAWIPRYGLVLAIPVGIASGWLFQRVDSMGFKRVRDAFYGLAVVLLLIQVVDAWPSIKCRELLAQNYTYFKDENFLEEYDKKRFIFLDAEEGSSIGLEMIRPYEDDPHWYKYWGRRWQNRVTIVKEAADLPMVDYLLYPDGDSRFMEADIKKSFTLVLTDTTNTPEKKLTLKLFKRLPD